MLPLTVPCKLLFKNCSALTSYMTSSICHHFSLYSHGYGQYFPWSNFRKKNILVFSSLSSFRLGLSPYRLGEKGAPYYTLREYKVHSTPSYTLREYKVHSTPSYTLRVYKVHSTPSYSLRVYKVHSTPSYTLRVSRLRVFRKVTGHYFYLIQSQMNLIKNVIVNNPLCLLFK